jgi:hypothetical protein
VADAGRVVAGSDCERIRDGWITQPVNTLSSVAYVVAGGLLVRRARRRSAPRAPQAELYGWSVVAVGLGSIAYHGPGGRWSRQVHDGSLVALEALIAIFDLAAVGDRPPPAGRVLALVPALSGLAARPSMSTGAQVSMGAVALGAEGARARRQRGRAGPRWERRLVGPVWAAGAVAQTLGRTGGPWCRPDSWAQPHAAWHVLSALGLWLRGRDAY